MIRLMSRKREGAANYLGYARALAGLADGDVDGR